VDIERVIVRMTADASQYLRVFDVVEARLVAFGGFLGENLVRSAMKLAMEFERMGIAFEVMTGSAEKGKAVLSEIMDLAVRSPFTSQELVKSAKQAMAFGFEVNDIIPVLSRLGDVSVATGSDMDRLILALGQVRTTGRLMGQELRQFTNAGVPILQYLAKAMGVAEAQVPQLVRMGAVGFNDVAKAFNLMTNAGGRFFGMMERTNLETVFGRWQNFTESIQIFSRRVGDEIFKAFGVRNLLTEWTSALASVDLSKLGEVMKTIRDAIVAAWNAAKGLAGVISDWAAANPNIARLVVGVVALAAGFKLVFAIVSPMIAIVSAFFTPLVAVLGTVLGMINMLVAAVGGPLVGAFLGLVGTILTPIGLVVSGFLALGVAILAITGNLGKVGGLFRGFMGAAWEATQGVAGFFVDLFAGILDQAGRTFGRLIETFAGLGDIFKTAFSGMFDAFAAGNSDLGFDILLRTLQYGFKAFIEWMKVEMGLAFNEIWINATAGLKRNLVNALVWFNLKMESLFDFLPGSASRVRAFNVTRDAAMRAIDLDQQRDLAAAALESRKAVDDLIRSLRGLTDATDIRDLSAQAGADKLLGPDLVDVIHKYMRLVIHRDMTQLPEMDFRGAASGLIPAAALQARFQELWLKMADAATNLHFTQESRLRGDSVPFGAGIMGAVRLNRATEELKAFTDSVSESGAAARRAAAEISKAFEREDESRDGAGV
jgi:tape measure domain-containing protein